MLQQRPRAVLESAYDLVRNIDDQLAIFAAEMEGERDEPFDQ